MTTPAQLELLRRRRAPRAPRRLAVLLAVLGALLVTAAAAAPVAHARDAVEPTEIQVGRSPDRRPAEALDRRGVLSGDVYVFVGAVPGVTRARFYLDLTEERLEDPRRAGAPLSADTQAPFDLAGTAADGKARSFDTRTLADGRHTLTVVLDYADGRAASRTVPFAAHNGRRALLFASEPVRVTLAQRRRAFRKLTVTASDRGHPRYTLRESASWLTVKEPLSRIVESPTLVVDARGLAPGRHRADVTAVAAGYEPATTSVTVQVTAAGTCTPLPCSEALVDLPYRLEFSGDHEKILDGAGTGTGFTWIDKPATGSGYIPENLAVRTTAPTTLDITTTSGIAHLANNAQDNTLGVGIDAPSQVFVLDTTVHRPPAGTGAFEQGGLWFGNDQDNFVKLVILSTSAGTTIEYRMELGGAGAKSVQSSPVDLSGADVGLSLRGDPSDLSLTASYRVGTSAPVLLGRFVAPPELFSFDAAGIDPEIGTRSFGGVFATHRRGPSPVVYRFDDFSVTAPTAAPPGGSDITFDRVSFPITNPTSMAWGPDGRLYVSEMFGRLHAIRLDAAKRVVSDEVITTLGSRLTLGIAVDPDSTADAVTLWVSHSSPSTSNGALNSSTITRLSGPGFTTRQDVITGLPRAIANHAVNSIHFGPDGRLYIAAGGNTGAGAPNTAATEFGTRAEQPLSAALLVADVAAAGFDGTCATPEGAFAPSPCDVAPYATGLRNPYDFVWHSNGSLYSADNGLGVTGTYPPTPTPPCTGFADTASYTQGGHNPGQQPDVLLRLEPGKYYGHPNPSRNECVFKTGSYQRVAPLPNHVPPLLDLGPHRSPNGSVEYTADSADGALRGEMLIANYSTGDDITRIAFSSDGRSVVRAQQLATGFNDPLTLTTSPDGTIFVGEFGGDLVTALVPTVPPTPGTWSTRPALPSAVLDAGGAAAGGRLYVVAGKTSAGHGSTLRVYDPATGWTTGPSLPGPGVENPAVTALDDRIYAFGGSTAAFSGAVANAAVFDPALQTWEVLPAMPTARAGATAQAVGGLVYVAGGMGADGASLATLEIYDPVARTWRTGPPMATRRDNPGSAALGGRLYVFGGRTREATGTTVDGTLATTEMYAPGAASWVARAPMPTGRRTMAVGTLGGRAQLMGGEATSGGGSFPQNEEYDATTDTWRTLTPMPTPRHGAAAGTIAGVVYVAGGGTSAGTSFSTVTEAFTLDATPTPPPADTTPPQTTVDSGPSGAVSTTTAAFAFSASEPGATFRCRLDAAAFAACTSPRSYSGLTEGSHLFEVYAVDAAGNADATPASRAFRVDRTAPAVTTRSPGSGATGVAHAANVTVGFSEPMRASSITTTTLKLRRVSTGSLVTATVSYNATTRAATLNPATDLVPSASYTATVTSGVVDQAGNALTGLSWSFTTTGITAPSNLVATRYGYPTTTRIDLAWSDRSGNEVRFDLERSTSSTFGTNRVTYRVAKNVVTYRDTALAARTTYYYRVFAVSGSGVRSRASNVVSITTR